MLPAATAATFAPKRSAPWPRPNAGSMLIQLSVDVSYVLYLVDIGLCASPHYYLDIAQPIQAVQVRIYLES